MINDHLAHDTKPSQLGLETTTTNTSREEDLDKILAQQTIVINEFEDQIRFLELEMKNDQQPLNNISIEQPHFWLKRSSNGKNNEISITAQYLEDSVFNNLKQQHQIQLDKMFVQAKQEIDRLTGILISRDDQIKFLKGQQQSKINEVPLTTNTSLNSEWNINDYQKQHQLLKAQNNRLNNVAKQLKQQLSNKNVAQKSSPVSQNHLLQIQQKVHEIQSLNKIIQTLSHQFQSLRNENNLQYDHIEAYKLKINELQKIASTKINDINQLKNQLQVSNKKCDELNNKLNEQQRKSNNVVQNGSLANGVIRINGNNSVQSTRIIPNSSDLKLTQLNIQISKLKTDNSKLIININNLNRQIQQLRIKNNQLIKQLAEEKNKNSQSIILNRQLQSQIKINHPQPSIDLAKANNDLRNHVRDLESKILVIQKQNQQMSKNKRQIIYLQQTLKFKEDEWTNKRLNFEQQLGQSQLDFSNTINENQKLFNEILKIKKDYEFHIEGMRNELINKNNLIYELEAKQKDIEKSLNIYKNQFNDKKKGVLAFGTSNSLTDKTPEKTLIQNHQELIQNAKLLLSRDTQNQHNWIEPNNRSNLSVFEAQTNVYIQNLLSVISQHQIEQQNLQNQISKMRIQMQKMSILLGSDDTKGLQQILNQLQFQRKLTERLSDQIKVLKEELFHLNTELDYKNNELYDLSTMQIMENKKFKQIDHHLGDIQGQYQILLNSNRIKSPRQVSKMQQLLNEIQFYKIELEKASLINRQMQDNFKDQTSCPECYQYQRLVEELETRLQNYQKVMMGEMKKFFTSCEKQINQKGRIDIHSRIENLKQKSINKNIDKTFEQSRKIDSPRTRKPTGIKLIHKRSIMLDHLVQTQKLSVQAILVLMLKIIDYTNNEKIYQQSSPILPEHILLINFDKNNPQNAQIQISQSRQNDTFRSKLYLSPQRLRGCEPTRKSLVWNVGLIFHYIVNKKLFFNSESDILDKYLPYRYDNKLLSELKVIIQGMLEKESSKRKLFSHVKNLTNNELIRLNKMRERV